FLHPRYEPNVREPGIVPRNIAGKHKRKFLRSEGKCLDSAGRPADAELMLWGEWEPQSLAVRLHETETLGPSSLHTPFYEAIGGGLGASATRGWSVLWCCRRGSTGSSRRRTSMCERSKAVTASTVCEAARFALSSKSSAATWSCTGSRAAMTSMKGLTSCD